MATAQQSWSAGFAVALAEIHRHEKNSTVVREVALALLLIACQDTSGPDFPIAGGGTPDNTTDAQPAAASCRNISSDVYTGQETLVFDLECGTEIREPGHPYIRLVTTIASHRTIRETDATTCGTNGIVLDVTPPTLWKVEAITGADYMVECH